MEQYKDKISGERIRKVEKTLVETGVANRLEKIARSDEELREMMALFLSSERDERERRFHALLSLMRRNEVPEDLIWAFACATSQDAIATALKEMLTKR